MRRAGPAWLTLGLLVLAGCNPGLYRGDPKAPAVATAGEADVGRIVGYLNDNARKIDSFRVDKVDIDGKSEGKPIPLNAKLAYKAPRNFVLRGYMPPGFGSTEADLGSNDEEIWFWIARAKPPAVHYCKRKDLPNVRLTTPFQPDWIIEALGVTPLDPSKYRIGEATGDYITLLTDDRTPDGRNVIKRLIIDPATNRIMQYQVWRAGQFDKPIVQAWIDDYYEDSESGAFLPRKIELEWPDAKTKIALAMRSRSIRGKKNIHVNTITPEFAAQLFRRGEYTNAEVINLAEVAGVSADPRSIAGQHGRDDRQVRRARAQRVGFTGRIESDPATTPTPNVIGK